MLKLIVQHSVKLILFIELLKLNLTKPQYGHMLRLCDALIVSEEKHKTISSLYDIVLDAPCAENGADFLRISPWQVTEVKNATKQFVLNEVRMYHQQCPQDVLYISIDDSITAKDKNTWKLEPVQHHYDHTKSSQKKARYTNGIMHVEVRVQIGEMAYVYDWAIYMREKMVRRLNRYRQSGRRLRFRSKYRLVRAILADLSQQLPSDLKVYVLFDSWYASNKLLKFCHRQGWHIICAIKSNRLLDGVKLSQWNKRLKHQRYHRVNPTATEKRKRPYLVRAIRGRLKNVPFAICVLISKRHRGDKRPKYFMCTDLSLSPQQILRNYKNRWPIEVDNYYVKQFLGLGDFRVQSYEAVEKWFAIVFLAYIYCQWRLNHAESSHLKSVADVIRLHRQEHMRTLLHTVGQSAIDWLDLKRVCTTFMGGFP